jgi:hypothetical protein
MKMKKNCLICKNRKKCLNYQLGGLFDTWCDRFIEEPEITEEEQIIADNKFREENSVKSYKLIKIVIGLFIITILASVLFIIYN